MLVTLKTYPKQIDTLASVITSKMKILTNLFCQFYITPLTIILFTAEVDGKLVGFGHLAREGSDWELAVSVDSNCQGRGVANSIMDFMIDWGTTRGVHSVFMHCITQNAKIQHLARKHGLRMVERDGAEVTSRVDLPSPTPLDYTAQFLQEQQMILEQIVDLQRRMIKNFNPVTFTKEHTLD